MTTMRDVVIPKSDQANYDDFIGGATKTIKVTKVTIGNHEQPVAIHYENDNGKPWKPCKSMCRVLLHCWGGEGADYVGRLITLYGDPDVKFAGVAVGGIRISHLSHIENPMTLALTMSGAKTSKAANRKLYTVQPLIMGGAHYSGSSIERESHAAPETVSPAISLQDALDDIATAPNLDGLKHKYDTAVRAFKTDDERKQIIAAKEKRKTELTATG